VGTRLRGRVENACDVERTFRVRQMEGMFDVPPSEKSRQVWEAEVTLPEIVKKFMGWSGSFVRTRTCFNVSPILPRESYVTWIWAVCPGSTMELSETAAVHPQVVCTDSILSGSLPTFLKGYE
jgi:hypothetical protein